MSWSRIISISFSLMCLLEKLQNVRGNKADFWNYCTCSQNHSIAIVFNSCMTVIYRLLLWKLRSKMRLVELQLATFSLPQFHKCFFFILQRQEKLNLWSIMCDITFFPYNWPLLSTNTDPTKTQIFPFENQKMASVNIMMRSFKTIQRIDRWVIMANHG